MSLVTHPSGLSNSEVYFRLNEIVDDKDEIRHDKNNECCFSPLFFIPVCFTMFFVGIFSMDENKIPKKTMIIVECVGAALL
jgi:hypothetical protein